MVPENVKIYAMNHWLKEEIRVCAIIRVYQSVTIVNDVFAIQ